MSKPKQYDIIIIGGGPAGLSAGVYTARARLSSLLIEKEIIGGKVVNAELIENYPGFPQGISGYDLTDLMHQQATKFGVETLIAEVTSIDLGDKKLVKTAQGDFAGRAIIIAGGTERQKLGVPGEDEFVGRGVSYCATCDAPLFANQSVAVAGGGNAAIEEALHLTKFASKVTLIHRRGELRATRIVQERAFANPKIKFMWNSTIEQIKGNEKVKSLKLHNVQTGKTSTLSIDGIFVAIGFSPSTSYLKGLLSLDAEGYIITNDKMETGIRGVFAAGDIRSNSIRQVASAVGDGATAAVYAERFLVQSK
jgi:thioredoxin reductase (NADPH)